MTTDERDVWSYVVELLKLGLPLVGTNLSAFAIHMTDTLMLGWYDVSALAAATVSTSLYFILFILGGGFGMAVLPIVSSATVSGDVITARRATRMSMWLGSVYFVVVVLALWRSEALFLALGQEPKVAALAQEYLRIAVFGMLPALCLMSLRSFLSALNQTKIQLWITFGGIFLNAAVNYVLIFGHFGAPELGVKGAAIASVLIQFVMFAFFAVYSHVKEREFHLFQRIWKADWDVLSKVLRLGVPIGLTSLAEGGMFTASAIMMGWIGEVELAAHGIALQLVGLTFMFHVGMSQAATVLAGRAYGQSDEEALRQIALAAISIAGFFGVVVVCVFCAFPSELVRLFVSPDEPRLAAILPVGATLVIVSTMFQFMDSGQIVALSLLRGVHDTTVPMWLATVSYWIIGLAASYFFAFMMNWGPMGLWFGLSTGLAAAAFSLMARFWTYSVRISAIKA